MIVGPEIAGSLSASIRPWLSTGTFTTRLRPRPSRPNDLVTEGCASALTITVIGGAPKSPSASAFQPACLSTLWRAAASAQKFATVAPVTKAPLHSGGRRKTSSNHRKEIFSRKEVVGV